MGVKGRQLPLLLATTAVVQLVAGNVLFTCDFVELVSPPTDSILQRGVNEIRVVLRPDTVFVKNGNRVPLLDQFRAGITTSGFLRPDSYIQVRSGGGRISSRIEEINGRIHVVYSLDSSSVSPNTAYFISFSSPMSLPSQLTREHNKLALARFFISDEYEPSEGELEYGAPLCAAPEDSPSYPSLQPGQVELSGGVVDSTSLITLVSAP